MSETKAYDPIPRESFRQVSGPNDAGLMSLRIFAFNTVVTIQAFGDPATCKQAFARAEESCRAYERLFSRTLPHSDISRLNAAGGDAVEVAPETADLLHTALAYCADSCGKFDITIGPATRLWNWRAGVIPDADELAQALSHVDWRGVRVWEEGGSAPLSPTPRFFARLDDPQASVDVGGIAKGWIADRLSCAMQGFGIDSFVVNLGGNVVAHGQKPGGLPWRIGLQDPRDKSAMAGVVPVRDASAVTSGVYERFFMKDGRRYHHILDPASGQPAQTDCAGATVIARKSIDAEGYSTTLLALGIESGMEFARAHQAIEQAFFITWDGEVLEA